MWFHGQDGDLCRQQRCRGIPARFIPVGGSLGQGVARGAWGGHRRCGDLSLLTVLLFVQLVFVVNQLRLSWIPSIAGIAPTNMLFILTLLAMLGKTEVVREKGMLRKALIYFGAALTLAFLIALLRGVTDFMEDLTYWKNALFFPLFYFMYLKCKQDEKTTRLLIIWILVIVAVAGLEAFRQGLDYGFGKYHPLRRASGPFGTDYHNANRAGVFYGMFIPMFIAIALFLKNKIWRLAALFGCFLMVAATISTYSRQAYGLILLAIVVLLLRRNLIYAVLIGGILVSLVGFLPDSAFQRVEETKQQSKNGGEEADESTASRWEIWSGGLSMFAANPLGVGLNRFKKEIGNYAPAHRGFDAHNFYVLTLAECGPFGIASLLFLIFSIFKLARFLRKAAPDDDPELRALTIGFSVTALNMALGGLYGSPTLEGAVMAPFWALCGLLERYVILRSQSAGQAPQSSPAPEPSLVERFPLAAHISPGQRR